jgi:PAS domain S-box-containing protein
MEEAGDTTESIFRRITENTPYALALVDRDGRIVLVNTYFEQLFGYSRDELLERSIDVLIPDRFKITHEAYRRSFNEHPVQKPIGMGRDLYALRKNGEEIPVEIALSPIQNGEKSYVLAAIADITLRKQAEEVLRQSEARLSLALSAANAGTWDWDILRDEVTWSEGSYHLLGLKPGECEASAKKLPSRPLWVEADFARLTQVFSNLLDNAAKYTNDGGISRLRVEAEGESGVVRVQDNGMGISPSSLPHIFDLFTQEPRSLDRAQGGLGIGLSLVKRLVEMHGGEVEAHSGGTGAGSEFVVRLPLLDLDSCEQGPLPRVCEESDATQEMRTAG